MARALVFPGQGAQKVGMGAALAEKFPLAREILAEADEVLGFACSKVIAEGPEERTASGVVRRAQALLEGVL